MKIKLSPSSDITKTPTTIRPLGNYSLEIDGEVRIFDSLDGEWLDISKQTDGAIIEAHLEGNELYVTVRRYYDGITHPDWDDGEYHELEVKT